MFYLPPSPVRRTASRAQAPGGCVPKSITNPFAARCVSAPKLPWPLQASNPAQQKPSAAAGEAPHRLNQAPPTRPMSPPALLHCCVPQRRQLIEAWHTVEFDSSKKCGLSY